MFRHICVTCLYILSQAEVPLKMSFMLLRNRENIDNDWES